MTEMEMRQRMAELEQENARLKAKNTPSLRLKVSQKGAVSLYGLGRFPVTLYGQQWERVLGFADTIREFISVNSDSLATKD